MSILAEITRRGRAHRPARAAAPTAAVTDTERDPVCGMTVSAVASLHQADAGGKTYHFCCAHCRDLFLAEPHKYAAAAAQEG